MEDNTIVLVLSTGKKLTLNKDLALQSKYLEALIKHNSDDEYPIVGGITEGWLRVIIKILENHKDNKEFTVDKPDPANILKSYLKKPIEDRQIIENIPKQFLLQGKTLAYTAHFLDIPYISQLIYQYTALLYNKLVNSNDSAAIAKNLSESELFANAIFTADCQRKKKDIQEKHGDTSLLQEIDNMSYKNEETFTKYLTEYENTLAMMFTSSRH
jgi:hypothetical protein